MASLRDRFVASFGEYLAVSIEAAVERHIPELKFEIERGSDPFRFALVWAVGLECLSRPEFRTEHGITVPWEMLRDWIRGIGLLAGFDGTFDAGGRGAGLFDEILGRRTETDVKAGQIAADGWQLAQIPGARA
jgi:hypothetical protein